MTTSVPSTVRDAALRWIADDPHAGDRAELQRVLAGAMGGSAADRAELTDRMAAPLTFGTAGLRGPLRAGPAGMNAAVVVRTAAGLAGYLHGLREAGATVVVGFDARHRSEEFAHLTARALAAKGFRVLLAPGALPTPVTAFAVRWLDAAAGVQITASHNPPQDNGIKVYLRGGAQIISPSDEQIEAAIAAVGAARSVPLADFVPLWPDDLLPAYIARAAAVTRHPGGGLRVAVTPLHGVGGATLVSALHEAGYTDVRVVAAQAVPDPDFSTVDFPNPEEPGATDLLLALAAESGADLAVANDPDADRCALGVPDRDGRWRMLSGDETGVLLGDHLLSVLDRSAYQNPLVATTIVSSQQLGKVAAARQARYAETLTGFKWIVRAGDGLVYGYEEALGLCVDPDAVLDKDGISAAVLACDLVSLLKGAGETVNDRLDELARAHGLHTTGALPIRVSDPARITAAMARLRAGVPSMLAGEPVTDARDLRPRTDAVVLRTATSRVVVRPSGTEPKLKCYLEIVTPVPEGADLVALRADAGRRLEQLSSAVRGVLGL